jgi:hypothetical protein
MDKLTKTLEKAIVEQDWLTIATIIKNKKINLPRRKIVDILSEVYLQGGQASQP